jgi:hypothetical protein
VDGKFDPIAELSEDELLVRVTGPIQAEAGTKVDLLVVVLYEDTGQVAIGKAGPITCDGTRQQWWSTVADRDGGKLTTGRATGWASASVVTNDGGEGAYGPWRVSTYSWDVPITIEPTGSGTQWGA